MYFPKNADFELEKMPKHSESVWIEKMWNLSVHRIFSRKFRAISWQNNWIDVQNAWECVKQLQNIHLNYELNGEVCRNFGAFSHIWRSSVSKWQNRVKTFENSRKHFNSLSWVCQLNQRLTLKSNNGTVLGRISVCVCVNVCESNFTTVWCALCMHRSNYLQNVSYEWIDAIERER